MSTPIVFDIWAGDGPRDPVPDPAPTAPPSRRGRQAVRIVLAAALGAAGAVGTLTVVDNVTSARVERTAPVPDDPVPHRMGRCDLMHPTPPC
ncbi:hypothetical protein AAG589_07225 [Isoptericola sp. F-RaC21]|uniref:hypothetical protein n=1 Tax=Isoptericola sp. F-RaC21 TaxID=3141452 RepID=UPI00315C2122